MPRAEHEFGHASQLKADSVGTPGQRRFRLLIEANGGKACAWLEKQELQQLALGVQELLANYSPRAPVASSTSAGTQERGNADLDFQVGRLALGYDQQRDLFVLELSDEALAKRERATLRVAVQRERMREFADQALAVCAAGRPLCPLCQGPVGPGPHICPRANGHVTV